MATQKNLKLPPQDLEAESSVLGALMIDKNAIIRVADILNANDFYHPAHQKIYATIIELFEKGKPIDMLTVSNRLKEKKLLKEIGGTDFLAEIINNVPTSAHIIHYANIVRENRVRRDLIQASSEINEKAFEHENFERLMDDVERRIFGISEKSRSQKFVPVKDELPAAYERLEKLHRGEGGGMRGVPTEFPGLDSILSGLQKSDLIILGARPSFGKTAFALDIARQAAAKNRAVGIFSLEMSREQVLDRIISSQAQIPLWRLRTGRLNDELEFSMIQKALDEISKMPLFIDDTPSPNILQMRSMARRLQLDYSLDLLIVDYLQLIQPRTDSDNIVAQVTEISRGLKSLARELNIPVLAVSQLSRAVDQREIKIPRLSDLRESGCLTGETLIALADGRKIQIKDIVEKEKLPLKIFALDDNYKQNVFEITAAFSTGKKQIFELKTKSGRIIKASGNHPFLYLKGWERLENLESGNTIGLPRKIKTIESKNPLVNSEIILIAHLLGDGYILPKQPYHYTNAFEENIESVNRATFELFGIKGKIIKQKNWYHTYLSSPYKLSRKKKHPITDWFAKLGLERVRSYEKRAPNSLFECDNQKISLFLKHLWSTDGNLSWKNLKGRKPAGNIYYSTTSKTLADQVQHLLLRLGVQSSQSKTQKKKYRPNYAVRVQGAENQIKFLEIVGIADRRKSIIPKMLQTLEKTEQNPNNDVIPKNVWPLIIQPAKETAKISWREFLARIDMAYCGSSIFKSGLSRERMERVCTALAPRLNLIGTYEAEETSKIIHNLATSDVYWDPIVSITPLGKDEVYDITVNGAHNFIANDIFVHNSLEQDADVVMFIYRKDREKMDLPEEEQNMVEILVAKHRNGPLGTVKLRFDPEKVSFRNIDTRHDFNEN